MDRMPRCILQCDPQQTIADRPSYKNRLQMEIPSSVTCAMCVFPCALRASAQHAPRPSRIGESLFRPGAIFGTTVQGADLQSSAMGVAWFFRPIDDEGGAFTGYKRSAAYHQHAVFCEFMEIGLQPNSHLTSHHDPHYLSPRFRRRKPY